MWGHTRIIPLCERRVGGRRSKDSRCSGTGQLQSHGETDLNASASEKVKKLAKTEKRSSIWLHVNDIGESKAECRICKMKITFLLVTTQDLLPEVGEVQILYLSKSRSVGILGYNKKSCIQNVTQVKVEKYYHLNIVKVPPAEGCRFRCSFPHRDASLHIIPCIKIDRGSLITCCTQWK